MNYSLLLVSQDKPDEPSGITNSNQLVAYGLWEALSKLSHVSLHYQADHLTMLDSRFDFVLIHSFLHAQTLKELSLVKQRTNKQVMWISEKVPPIEGIDHSFTFLPYPENWGSINQSYTHIPLPTPTKLLHNSMIGVQKIPGSIFLDHNLIAEPNYCPFYADWSDRLYEWLEQFKDERELTQMERDWSRHGWPKHVFPNWIKVVPEMSYTAYLRITAPFENFIQTHPGAYEHSVIDMVGRGIRVLVPVEQGKPFLPKDTINRLKLQTFSDKAELLDILAEPVNESWKATQLNDMETVAMMIDKHCQEVIRG